MLTLFCKISAMKYYKGACEKDQPYNGGKFVLENGYGAEQYNFLSVEVEGVGELCLGFVETKTNPAKGSPNDLHFEKIKGCETLKNEDSVDGVLVVWCATTALNETSIVGWYRNATIFRTYQECEFDTGDVQLYNVIALKENCVLLPQGERHRHIWDAPVAKVRTFGFGQSMIWYASEDAAQKYIIDITDQIENYKGENWIDRCAED